MHVHGLDTQRMTNHLLSSCPFNAAVTTLTITAKIGGPLHRLDSDLLLLDVFTDTFRTGSVAFRNSRVVRMQLRSTRGLRWISTKVFRNGTLHICGAYATDVAEFVTGKLVDALNKLYHDGGKYTHTMGDVLMANYRFTCGKRLQLRSVVDTAMREGHVTHMDPRETSAIVRLLVDVNLWGSVRCFPSGAVVISLPCCGNCRAQMGALTRAVAFVQLL